MYTSSFFFLLLLCIIEFKNREEKKKKSRLFFFVLCETGMRTESGKEHPAWGAGCEACCFVLFLEDRK